MPASQQYDVVIIGAGICGLNAAFVASAYLGKGGRIALVDRRGREGGMWNDTYDYVHLHQAHPLFTVGNLRWQWDKDPNHLSSKPEILDHLAYCLSEIRKRVELVEFFRWEYDSHSESGGRVHTTIQREGEQVVLESERMVKALGFNVPINPPLRVTSTRVQSVSPDFCDVRTGAIAESGAPVWIIGGGKTAMDTAYALITADPTREVNMLAGSGTWFIRRAEMYHPGHGMRGGTRPNMWAERMAMAYDGTNEAEVFAADAGIYTKATPTASNFLVGIIADAEVERIRTGVRTMLTDHLVDVVDTENGPELVLRTGRRTPVPDGSWILNCTGYLLHPEEYEPYTSHSGRVLSINQRSDVLLFSTYAGYLLTHALMRGKLAALPLAEIDWIDLRTRYGSGTTPAAWTVLLHNFAILATALPPTVFMRMGVDGDHWYPFVRRQVGLMKFMLTRRRQLAHYETTMATVRERYGVRCGPLTTADDRVSA